jgi:hypothetical protein
MERSRIDRARQRASAAKRFVLAAALGVFGVSTGLAWASNAGHTSGLSKSVSSSRSRSVVPQPRLQTGFLAPATAPVAPVVQTSQS